MKKGLLTVLAASLVFVGCQNYDDQFDDLNAQISALKSQVDGLGSLSAQVASLSGTISGLQSGVAAAQASAAAANTAASGIDLSGLSASLAELETKVNAVQASLAGTATAASVTTLQAEIDAIELDLDDLLASSNIYSTDVTVTNATTLNSALALGNKINVLNATLTITGYTGMDYAEVQKLVDRVNTTTGNIVYSAAGSTGTEIIFNNLTSAGDITMTQPGGYSFPKLSNAGTIDLKDDHETTVTNISFPLLTTATAIKTDATGTMEVIFTYATNVDFGAMVTAPSNTITITTKKDATLDLGAWLSQDASGNKANATLTLNGPASFTNGTAAGTFASTGLPGNTVGAHDGTISLTNVATAAIHNFRGTITLNTGVKNFTGNNVVAVGHSGATDLETLNVTQIRDNDPGLSAAAVTNLDDSDDNTAQDWSITSSHNKLTTVTLTGKGGDVSVDNADTVATIDMTGLTAFNIDITNNDALATYTDASVAENWLFDNNDLITSVNASHTTQLTATGDTGVQASITGNAELASLTIGFSNVDDLDITSNAKLATLAASSLTSRGTTTTSPVDIYDNAFVASSVKDSMESDATRAATGWAVGGSTDTGTITSDSGLSTLDTYLASALGSTSTISVWFDSVTKLETQSVYGGAYTDNTSNLPTAAFTRNSAAAVDFSTSYTGYLVYLYNVDAITAVTVTDGAISLERKTYAFDLNRDATSQAVAAMASGEGLDVNRGAGKGQTSFVQGASYTGSANGSTVANLTDLINYINADTTISSAADISIAAAQDGYKKGLYTINYLNSSGSAATAGTASGTGNLEFAYGTNDGDGRTKYLVAAIATDNAGADDLAHAIRTAINDTDEWAAVATGGNGNQFFVTKHTSGTPGTMDTSPLAASFPTIDYQLGNATTTIILVDSGYDGAYTSETATAVNANGLASTLFQFTDDSATVYNGLRVTLTNNTGIAFNAEVGLDVNYSTVSNTMLVSDNDSATALAANTTGVDGNNLVAAGVNIATYVSRYTESPATYVAAFSAISAGTARTTTAGVTAVLTNRTGW